MDEAETTRELALRLLAPQFPGDPRPYDAQLLVGQTPEGFTNDIPLPDGCRVLGSLVRSQWSVEVLFDTDQSPEQIRGFYETQLTASGWRKVELFQGIGGFTMGTELQHAVFCRSKRGPALTVGAQAVPDHPTRVRLDLQLDSQYSPCAQTAPPDDPWKILPHLVPPAGARQTPGGAGGGGDSVYSSAQLMSDLEIAVIAAHYTRQLEAVGWTRHAEGQDGPLAWSTWTFQDDDGQNWQGWFFALRTSGQPGKYMLQVHVQWTNAGGGMPGPVGMAWSI